MTEPPPDNAPGNAPTNAPENVPENALREALSRCFAKRFETVEVARLARLDSGDGWGAEVRADGDAYPLRIYDEALAGAADADALCARFDADNLANVAADLVGFAVSLTANGCVFDS